MQINNVQKMTDTPMQGLETIKNLRTIIYDIINNLAKNKCSYFQELIFNDTFILFRKLHYLVYSLNFNIENNKILWDHNRELIIDLLNIKFQVIEASNLLNAVFMIDTHTYKLITDFYQQLQNVVQLNKEAEQEAMKKLQLDTIQ